MRGRERKASGPERRDVQPGVFHFSTATLPAEERAVQWQDVIGRTLTGCTSSPLPEGEIGVDFGMVAAGSSRLAVTELRNVRNNRDRFCLNDGDDDLVFFLLLGGEATVDHRDQRHILRPGDGVLARFDQPIDTAWPNSRLMLIRLRRNAAALSQLDRTAGELRSGSLGVMKLLRTYASAAWQEGVAAGTLTPMIGRHITELVGAACAPSGDEGAGRQHEALTQARVAAMREAIRNKFAEPCLRMRDVAAFVGLSERSGYLAFEKAGLDFSQEVLATRLQGALERLQSGGERVVDVAYSVGFSDLSHFHRLFKRQFGCTPAEARSRK